MKSRVGLFALQGNKIFYKYFKRRTSEKEREKRMGEREGGRVNDDRGRGGGEHSVATDRKHIQNKTKNALSSPTHHSKDILLCKLAFTFDCLLRYHEQMCSINSLKVFSDSFSNCFCKKLLASIQ